jgi:hypothetical protein
LRLLGGKGKSNKAQPKAKNMPLLEKRTSQNQPVNSL